MQLVVDIETSPVPDDRSKFPELIHCIVAADVNTGAVYEAGPTEIADAVAFLWRAQRLIGHNLARFDLPCLEERFGVYGGEVFDTYSAAQVVYASNLIEYTARIARTREIPKELWKSHKLEVWAMRLGLEKRHAEVDLSFFARWSPELQERCRSDIGIASALYSHLLKEPAVYGWPENPEAPLLLESRVAYMIGQQERNGVGFDREKAAILFAELHAERERLETDLRARVQPWLAPDGRAVVPKRSRTAVRGRLCPTIYSEGAEYQKIKRVEFNPASCQHRAWALAGHTPGPRGYGWKPTEFTPEGLPVTDEETLADLDYPIVPALRRYLIVNKRLGQLSDGTHAWVRKEVNGRIHGAVHVTGTRTCRAAHFAPNLGQVPKCTSEFGPECRELFRPTRAGWVQVGIDAKGLELRLFANRLAKYDSGAFIKIVLEGDPHAAFMRGTLIFIRDFQKTWTYAFLYGAGNEKLGLIILADWRVAFERGMTAQKPLSADYAEGLGRISRERLLKTFGALDELLRSECRVNYQRGWFEALDGRILACPSAHGALNDLLQSDGAIVIKHAMPLWYAELTRRFGAHGKRWAQMLWVHDEWQLECEREIAQEVGEVICESIASAGRKLGLRCPMEGEYKIGGNWRETH